MSNCEAGSKSEPKALWAAKIGGGWDHDRKLPRSTEPVAKPDYIPAAEISTEPKPKIGKDLTPGEPITLPDRTW